MSSSSFTDLLDLAGEGAGGCVLAASDDFFAEKENLIKAADPVFAPDKYTDHGKWMDGWETRRRRTPGHDWCVIKLGLRGVIQNVDIDTNHFVGNHPPFASLDAVAIEKAFPTEAPAIDALPWAAILTQSPLMPGSQNLFTVSEAGSWT